MLNVIVLSILSVVSIVLFLLEWRKWRVSSTKLKNYQQVRGLPILGVGSQFIGQNNEQVMATINKMFHECDGSLRPIYGWFGPVLLICIDEPEDMQIILNAEQCLDKPYMYGHLQNKTGLLGSRKEVWKVHRRALNPTFNPKVLASFIPTFNAKAKILADQLDQSVGQNIEIYRPVFKCLMDMIVNTALGMQWQLQNSRGDVYHDIFIRTMDLFNQRMVRFWLKWDFVYNLTAAGREEHALLKRGYQFLRGIREVKAIELADKMNQGEDVLETNRQTNSLTWIQKCLLLFREGKFDENELVEEVDTAFVGGTDTTTVAVSGALIMLAIRQDLQEKVVAELHEIFANADSPITYDDLSKMSYTEMVIKEALRHYPVAPFIGRECSEDLEFRDGIIPKGAVIVMNILKMHKDERIWGPNANTYYPDHFLPENISKIHPYAYLAFSGGPRNCIGIKYAWCGAKIILAYLLRRYKFTTDLKYEDVRTKMTVILKISNDRPVRVERRQW